MTILAILFCINWDNAIYKYELKRSRKYKPDLSEFKIHYEKRKEDGRPGYKRN